MNQPTLRPDSLAERLLSLDVLRGLDMFVITGGSLLFKRIASVCDWGPFKILADQMDHSGWQGLTLFDLVFPLFMFISGVAIPLALKRYRDQEQPKIAMVRKVIRRCLILVCLGWIYNGLFQFDFKDFRFASVLAQIGVAYMLTAFIVINHVRMRTLVAWTAAILVGYSLIQLLVPVPGSGAGVLTPTGSINAYFDQLVLPGKLYGGTYDPEGILCIISATAITLMGAIAGLMLQKKTFTPLKKAAALGCTGLMLFSAGLVFNIWYPMIKNIWTSTFNLAAAGLCFMLLALLYLVIDVWKIRKWSVYFQVIGLNAITIYMGTRIFDFHHSSRFFFGGLAKLAGDFGPVILSLGFLAIVWLILYFLYRQEIFLRV